MYSKKKEKEKSKQNRNHIIVLHFQSFDTHLYMMKSRIHISSRCECIRDCLFTLFVIAYTFLYNVCFALCPSKHFSLNILASLYNSKQASKQPNQYTRQRQQENEKSCTHTRTCVVQIIDLFLLKLLCVFHHSTDGEKDDCYVFHSAHA